jgi:hypothetical protein
VCTGVGQPLRSAHGLSHSRQRLTDTGLKYLSTPLFEV